MVFGACATHFIHSCSTVQCALYIATGAQTQFVDRCPIRNNSITITEKLLQSKSCRHGDVRICIMNFVRVRTELEQKAEYICTTFVLLSCGDSDCCSAVRCGDVLRCVRHSRGLSTESEGDVACLCEACAAKCTLDRL